MRLMKRHTQKMNVPGRYAVSPERVTSILQQHTIVLRYLLGKIGEEWNIEPPQPSLRTGDLNPGQMGILGVYRTCHHFSIDGSEFVHAVAEGNDLSWTHKCTAVRLPQKIQR